MGYYVINNLIKERINNMFEAIKQMQTISLKQMDCINNNADNLNKLAEFLKEMQEVSSQGSSMYEEKDVYTIGGVQYRKLKDGTVIRIGAL